LNVRPPAATVSTRPTALLKPSRLKKNGSARTPAKTLNLPSLLLMPAGVSA